MGAGGGSPSQREWPTRDEQGEKFVIKGLAKQPELERSTGNQTSRNESGCGAGDGEVHPPQISINHSRSQPI